MTTSSADEGEQQRSLWESFDRDDRKTFLVTLAGTVAANVLTVTILAIAVIIARPSVSGQPKTPANTLWYLALAVIFTAIAVGGVASWRHRDRHAGQRRAGSLVAGGICGLLGLLCLLALIGEAVGVK